MAAAGPVRRADIAVQASASPRLPMPGRCPAANAAEVIEADGLLVTPGFIDPHTHYDGQATWDDRLAPSADHGVSTVVMGNCGVGFAPVRPQHKAVLIDLMEGVEDIPGAALHDGIQWAWESFPEYLDALAAKPPGGGGGGAASARSAAHLRHRRRRGRQRPGDRCADRDHGSVGGGGRGGRRRRFPSSNRITLHTSVSGEAVPGTFAESREVSAIMAGGAEERAQPLSGGAGRVDGRGSGRLPP